MTFQQDESTVFKLSQMGIGDLLGRSTSADERRVWGLSIWVLIFRSQLSERSEHKVHRDTQHDANDHKPSLHSSEQAPRCGRFAWPLDLVRQDVILDEAQSLHVVFHLLARKVLRPVTVAGFKLGRGLLAPQYVNRVLAPARALLAPEHRFAEHFVVVQGLPAGGVGLADPLSGCAGNHSFWVRGVIDLIFTNVNIRLASLAELISGAITLKRKLSKD